MTTLNFETYQGQQPDPASLPDHTRLGIQTPEFGAISIADLYKVDDLAEKGAKASAMLRAIDLRVAPARSTRDVAGLILIQPYQLVQRPYDAEMDKIAAALEAGRIQPATAHKRRQAAAEKKRAGMVGIKYKPVHVYRDLIDVSRGLFVRMQHREASLPTAEAFLETVCAADPRLDMVIAEVYAEHPGDEMAAVAAVAVFKREECKIYDALAEDIRAIRDEVGLMLLNGNPKLGRPPMSNADVSRLFQLTTARVAQMRYGTR